MHAEAFSVVQIIQTAVIDDDCAEPSSQAAGTSEKRSSKPSDSPDYADVIISAWTGKALELI